MESTIYKVVSKTLWQDAEAVGIFTGAEIDLSDGFIHFSSADQVRETVRLHFANQRDLLLVAVDTEPLGDLLRWEPSRNGELFPHLYGELLLSYVRSVVELPLGDDGSHVFPEFG